MGADCWAVLVSDSCCAEKVEKLRRKEKDARIHKRLSRAAVVGQGLFPDEVARPPRCLPTHGEELACPVPRRADWSRCAPWITKATPADCTASGQIDQLKQEVATGRFKCVSHRCAIGSR